MGVESRGRSAIESAYRRRTGWRGDSVRNRLEIDVRPHPALYDTRIQLRYFIRIGGHEIVIKCEVVVLDDFNLRWCGVAVSECGGEAQKQGQHEVSDVITQWKNS